MEDSSDDDFQGIVQFKTNKFVSITIHIMLAKEK